MYNIRVRTEENTKKPEMLENTPKVVVASLLDGVNRKAIIQDKLEEIMFRLARISYESYNICHSSSLLLLVSEEIQDRFNDECDEMSSYNSGLNTYQYLIKNHLHYSPLSIQHLLFQWKRIASYSKLSKKNTPSHAFSDMQNKRIIKGIIGLIINSYRMKRDINKFCRHLMMYQREAFAINEDDFRTPIGISELLQETGYHEVYRYLGKKKVLYLDCEQMIETLGELNLEYQKLHPQNERYFTGKYINSQTRLLTNTLPTGEVSVKKDEIIPESEKSPRQVFIEVLEGVGLGKEINELFIVPRKKGESKERIYRSLAFAAEIIYDFHKHVADIKIRQQDLFTNMYIVPEALFIKLTTSRNKYNGIITKEFNVSEIDSKLFNRLLYLACKQSRNINLSERLIKEKIYECIKQKHPKYLSKISEPGYPNLGTLYKANEIFNI